MFPLVFKMDEEDDDRSYIRSIYEQKRELMLIAARRFVQTKYDQEEVISDALIALIKNSATLRTLNEDKLSAYIVTTVKNKAYDYMEKQNMLKRRFIPIDDVSNVLTDGSYSIDHRIILEEEIKLVLHAVDELPKKEKLVLLLKYEYNTSTSKIASLVGISKESVSKYLTRARNKIKAKVYGRKDKHE